MRVRLEFWQNAHVRAMCVRPKIECANVRACEAKNRRNSQIAFATQCRYIIRKSYLICMLNAYQMATQIYNDRLSKIAATYMANVKNAKTQVIEVSAAVVCGFVIILTLASLL